MEPAELTRRQAGPYGSCVLIAAPGLAIVGVVALLLAVVGAASFLIELGDERRRSHSDSRREGRMRRAPY